MKDIILCASIVINNLLEDEIHFVLKCKACIDLRRHYIIPRFYYARPSMLKFIELMTSNNLNILNKVGCCLVKAFERHNTRINNFRLNNMCKAPVSFLSRMYANIKL